MIVQRRLLDSILLQAPHYRRYLTLQQHEVAHHHRMIRNPFECHPGSESEGWLERDSSYHDLEIGAREAEFPHVARIRCALAAERLLHLSPVRRRQGPGSACAPLSRSRVRRE